MENWSMSSTSPRQKSSFWSRSAIAPKFIAAALCLAVGISSCGSKGGKSGGSNPDPQRSAGPNNPNDAGLNLAGRPVKLTDLRFIRAVTNLNWPTQPLTNEIRSDKNAGDVQGFEFTASRKSVFKVLAYLTSLSCSSNGSRSLDPDFALYSLTESDELGRKISGLNPKSEITLDPGRYAVTIAFDNNVSCSRLAIGFEASLTAVDQPQPTDSPSPTSSPGPTPAPTSSPTPNPNISRNVPNIDLRSIVLFATRKVPGSNERPSCEVVQAIRLNRVSIDSERPLMAKVIATDVGSVSEANVFFEQKASGSSSDSLEPLGYIRFLKQPGYPDNWIEILRNVLFESTPVRYLGLTADPNCVDLALPDLQTSTFLASSINLPNALPTRSTAGFEMEMLPLRSVTLSNGKAAPLLRISYAYPGSSPAQWQAEIGLDTESLARAIGGKDNLDNARMIVMDRVENFSSSPWIDLPREAIFAGPETVLKINEATSTRMVSATKSLLNGPSRRSLVFRYDLLNPIERNGIKQQFVDFVLDHGLFCEVSYSRPDGALFHKAIFKDLTNPGWNDKPNKEQRTGCAFAGSP
jgi:hypothetical protein